MGVNMKYILILMAYINTGYALHKEGAIEHYIWLQSSILENIALLENNDFMEDHFTKGFLNKVEAIPEDQIFCDALLNGVSCFSDYYFLGSGTSEQGSVCVQLIGPLIKDKEKYVGNKLIFFDTNDGKFRVQRIHKERMTWHDFGMKVLRGRLKNEVFSENCQK